MSYARFGQDGSDVYVFMDVGGYLNCCGCSRVKPGDHAHFSSTLGMVDHLRAHIFVGDYVPDYVVPELLADDPENFPPEERADSSGDRPSEDS
ncbi:hypothetical protein [Streptomyces sp. NPDC002855]|uniref:hypothetical protein n=1 Tax=Streptomyces sp. NPDC002855 TaxID=3154437 RepID=UPI00332B19D1